MRSLTDRKLITWRQLCAIATELLTADRTIDDCEWAERIKSRLAGLGFAEVQPPHQLTAAMRAVQRALEKSWGPRPAPLPVRTQPTPQLVRRERPWPRVPSGRWTSLPELLASLKASAGSGK